MEEIIRQLKRLGVHILCNHDDILVEIDNYEHVKFYEVDSCLHDLLIKNKEKRILLQCSKAIHEQLPIIQVKMKLTGERILFSKDLIQTGVERVSSFEVWPPFDPKSISFLSKVMNVSEVTALRYLQNMKSELPTQIDQMFTVFRVNDIPLGVVFPHIEPDTNLEGRLFWIGILPIYQGRGYGRALHCLGLERLKHHFYAKTYVGATSSENIPMQKIMTSNGCIQKGTLLTFEYKCE
ncbi:GNAT family N-acetyltransferase [Bacillus sp. BGMRC 2118]|nr:GNAT family N-acetyltransferase [Bacillus sp. BGMRC 2118]